MAPSETPPVQYEMLRVSTGVDWDSWQASAAPPETYDPPQLQAFYYGSFCPWPCCPNQKASYMQLNWYMHRSPCCLQPWVPGCCLQKCLSCCNPGYDVVPLAKPDAMFRKMLSVSHPQCPHFLRGVWWMMDNIAAEVLMTFQDADWSSNAYCEKRNCYNWTRDPTLFGTVLQTFTTISDPYLSFEISPDGKWIAIIEKSAANLPPMWMYIIQPGDKFVRPDGSKLETEPGDMMRINYEKGHDPTTRITYQYIVRRVAYIDDNGVFQTLQKTKGYEQLLQQATKPPAASGMCCNYCLCNLTAEEVAQANTDLNSHTALRYSTGLK